MDQRPPYTLQFFAPLLLLLMILTPVHSTPNLKDPHAGHTIRCAFPLRAPTTIHKSPVYPLGRSINALSLSYRLNSPLFPQEIGVYIRLREHESDKWSRPFPVRGEFHHLSKNPIDAVRFFFVTPGGTGIELESFTFTGELLSAEMMARFLNVNETPDPVFAPWPKPLTVSREGWGARPANGVYTPHEPHKIVIHHSYIPAAAQYIGSGTIRGIQNYHMDAPQTGWMDIGYHYLISPDGMIFEGRPVDVVGAHAVPNTTMVGICLIGNFDPDADLPTPEATAALLDLLSYLSSTFKIPVAEYYGHRDYSTKSCPGDGVYHRLDEFRSKVTENLAIPPAK